MRMIKSGSHSNLNESIESSTNVPNKRVYNPFVEDCDRRPPQEAFNPNEAPTDVFFNFTNEFNCDICKFKTHSRENYDLHVNGEEHKSNLDKYLQNKFQVSFHSLTGSSSSLPEVNTHVTLTRCHICDIDLSSKIVHDQHVAGKSHLKKLKLFALTTSSKFEEVKEKEENVRVATECKYTCDICKVCMKTKEQYDSHMSGKKHKSQEMKHKFNENHAEALKNVDEFLTPAHIKVGNRVKFDYFCRKCDKYMEDKMQLWHHLNSKQHQNKVSDRAIKWTREQVQEKRLRKNTARIPYITQPLPLPPISNNFVKGDTLYQPLQVPPVISEDLKLTGTEFLHLTDESLKRKSSESEFNISNKRVNYKMPMFYKNQLQTQQASFESSTWHS